MYGLFRAAGPSLICVLALAGCTTTKQTNTARTASEQLLISIAVDQSLDKVNFEGLAGTKVLLEEKYLDCVDKGYIVGSLRDRIVRSGGEIVAKIEEADVVLEVRSGGVGTDMSNTFAGIPGMTVPPLLTLPEVRFMTRDKQKGIAKIGLAAYDAKTMRALEGGGMTTSVANDNNMYVFGIGPYQSGSLRKELAKATAPKPDEVAHPVPTEVAFAPPVRKSRGPRELQQASSEESEKETEK